jgi:teichuronic acid biosynthesis glycosyltransferase TuaG
MVINKRVSVLMPAYNASKYISQAIDSVRAQTYHDWELIVVDDVSSDCTCQIVQGYVDKDHRVSLIRLKENRGPAAARNVGLRSSAGRYIAFLDADDMWINNKLEVQISLLMKSDASFTFSSYYILTDGNVWGRKYTIPDLVNYEVMLKGSAIGCLTVMYDIERLGPLLFDENPLIERNFLLLKKGERLKHEDYRLWLSLFKSIDPTQIAPVLSPLAIYRVSKSSYSSSKPYTSLHQLYTYKVSCNMGWFRSIYYYVHYALRGINKLAMPSITYNLDDYIP